MKTRLWKFDKSISLDVVAALKVVLGAANTFRDGGEATRYWVANTFDGQNPSITLEEGPAFQDWEVSTILESLETLGVLHEVL